MGAKAVAAAAPAPAPAALQARVKALAKAYGEDVGVAIMDVDSGWVAAFQGYEDFPQQSVSKIWLAVAVLDTVDRGRLSLDRFVIMDEPDRGVFSRRNNALLDEGPYVISVAELLHRSISYSDNAATDRLFREVGGPEAARKILDRKGLQAVRLGLEQRHLQSQIAGLDWRPELGRGWAFQEARAELDAHTRDAALAAYLADPADGASPVAVVQGLARLHRGELLSEEQTAYLLRLMEDTRTGPKRLAGGLPEDWTIGHKTGTGQDWRGASIGINDVGLLTAPDGRTYAVAVMMRRTWQPVPERLELFQAVSKAVVKNWTATADDPAIQLAKAR